MEWTVLTCSWSMLHCLWNEGYLPVVCCKVKRSCSWCLLSVQTLSHQFRIGPLLCAKFVCVFVRDLYRFQGKYQLIQSTSCQPIHTMRIDLSQCLRYFFACYSLSFIRKSLRFYTIANNSTDRAYQELIITIKLILFLTVFLRTHCLLLI